MIELLVNQNIPFYIVLTIFFTYIIWSKFLNNGKLAISNINELFDLCSIFLFMLISLIVGPFLFLLMKQFLGYSVNNMSSTTTYLAILLNLIGIIMIILFYRHKVPTKSELKGLFTGLIALYFLCALVFLGLVIVASFALKFIFPELIALWILLIILIFFCFFVGSVLFDDFKSVVIKKLKESIFHKDSTTLIIFSLGFVLLVVIFFAFYIPIIDYGAPSTVAYQVYQPHAHYGEAHSQVQVPIKVITFGWLDSFVRKIPIKFGNYDLRLDEFGQTHFSVLLNVSIGEYSKIVASNFAEFNSNVVSENKFFTNLVLNYSEKYLILTFDRDMMRRENVTGIIISGYVQENISTIDYHFSDNSRGKICSGNRCIIEINVSNNLTAPVYQRGHNLEFPNLNFANCSFVKQSFNDKVNSELLKIGHCAERECIIDWHSVVGKETAMGINLYLENAYARLSDFVVRGPLNARIQFEIQCE